MPALAVLLASAFACSQAGDNAKGPAPALAPSAAPTTPPMPSATPTATPAAGDFRAAVAVVDATPKVGVPLAGYTKRRRLVPDFDPNNDVQYFAPSTAVRDPMLAKALVLESGGERLYILSIDAIATIAEVVERIVAAARAKGSAVTAERLLAAASHTHSGPGALTSLGFWVQAATDSLVPRVRDAYVDAHAEAIVRAERSLAAARFGIGRSELVGATTNRRSGVSKILKAGDIDPELFVMRVDREDGTPLATLTNYGIHGTALPAANEALSADVMGAINRTVAQKTGAPALFANSAEADIAPLAATDAEMESLGSVIGEKVVAVRSGIATRDRVAIRVATTTVDFGKAELKLRADGLSTGALDLSLLGTLLGGPSGISSIPLDETMVEHKFRMTAVALDGDVISAVPGEPVHRLGLDIKARGKALGFANVLVFGLTNGFMSYVVDKDEYEAGGYEAAATFFGPDTGSRLTDACVQQIAAVAK